MTGRLFGSWTDAELQAARDFVDAFARETPIRDWSEDQMMVIHDVNCEIGRRRNAADLSAQAARNREPGPLSRGAMGDAMRNLDAEGRKARG